MSATLECIDHPTIGPLQGIRRCPEVNQFLGIQYGTLKDRFARGSPPEYPSSSSGTVDATKFGPTPLLPPGACEHEQRLIQQRLPFESLSQSDTECLTLNISVPRLDGARGIPVMVFLHGGAFATGSSSFIHCDLGLITNLSVEMGTPMISVGVNYRVGVAGFLHSPTMKHAGYEPNNGLSDQKLALSWIKNHIAGFGGDPERITLLGESAGAASGFFHLQSPEPLFHQLIAMSGSFNQNLRFAEQAEKPYNSVVDVLGASALLPADQLQAIIKTPGEELVAKVGRKFPMGPLIDGDSIPTRTTLGSMGGKDFFPGMRQCKRIMVGDCQLDGMAFSFRVAGRTDILPKTLVDCLKKTFDPINPQMAKDIVAAYGLDCSAESNTKENLQPILHYGNDVMFALPAREFTRAWSASDVPGTEALLCHFNAPNPWDGPWKGHASHIQDLAFVLLNSQGTLSVGQRLCAERYAKDIISFVNGGTPWPAYEKDVKEGAMVYFAPIEGDEDKSEFVPGEIPQRTKRRNHLLKIVGEELLDKLAEAWQLFMAGPK